MVSIWGLLMKFYLSHMEHVFLLGAFFITKGDYSYSFTRNHLMIYSGLFSWGNKYNKSLKRLVSDGFFKLHTLPPSNSYFYTLTPKALDYLQSIEHVQ